MEFQKESLKEYKSPQHKLVRCFERSRDSWKSKYQDRTYEAKILRNKILYLEKNKESWKDRALETEKQVKELKAKLEKSEALRQAAKKKRK